MVIFLYEGRNFARFYICRKFGSKLCRVLLLCRLAAQRWPPKAMDLRPMPVASFEDAFGLEIANLGTYDVESKYEAVLSPMVPRAALHLWDAGD